MDNVRLTTAGVAEARLLAANLRPADAVEVYLSSGRGHLEAILASLEGSPQAYAAWFGPSLAAVFGLGMPSLASSVGSPWMLGTPVLETRPATLLRVSRHVVKQWSAQCSRLENFVWEGNLASVRWLRWLGFTLGPARPFGAMKAPFHKFSMEGPCVRHLSSSP